MTRRRDVGDPVHPAPTTRLRFREMAEGDLDEMADLLGAPYPAGTDGPRRTRREAEAWIAWNRRNYAELGFGLWVVETRDGRFVGDCGLTLQEVEGEDLLEVGYHVHPDLRGQGYAAEAAAAVRDVAREAGWDHLVAIIRPDNLASQGVATKIGLQLERRVVKLGADALVFGADLSVPAPRVGP